MKNRKVYTLIIFASMILLLSFTALGLFIFDREIGLDFGTGKIRINNQNFLVFDSYTKITNETYDSQNKYYTYDDKTKIYALVDNVNGTNFSQYVENSLYIYNPEISTTVNASGESISCYATTRHGYSDENIESKYLNQIGFEFDFKSSIDTYLRIEFKDAWKSHKTYVTTNTIDERFIQKDKIGGKSPFAYSIDNNWIYDEENNCAYYKYIIPATCSNINESGAGISKQYSFRVNPEYWYDVDTSIAYREMIIVELSYNVSIVQANRAKRKWNVDFASLDIQDTYAPVE